MSDLLCKEPVVSAEEIEVQHELDTCGLFCPEPVMMLHNKIRDMSPGEVVRVLASDPSSKRDIPKFCNFLEHQLLGHWDQDKQFVYLIRKRLG